MKRKRKRKEEKKEKGERKEYVTEAILRFWTGGCGESCFYYYFVCMCFKHFRFYVTVHCINVVCLLQCVHERFTHMVSRGMPLEVVFVKRMKTLRKKRRNLRRDAEKFWVRTGTRTQMSTVFDSFSSK